MYRASGGYTLIEVMIFLAISSLLMVIGIMSVRGQSAHTEFITSVNDINTKMQQWLDQVTNGFSGSASEASQLATNYNCTLVSGYPSLSPGTNQRGANPDCVFLGKVIQVSNNATNNQFNHIYAYTVLGRRTTDGTSPVTGLTDSHPVAAIFNGSTYNVDLTEDYRLPSGTRVLSAKSNTPGALNSRLAGFFTGFGANNGVGALSSGANPLISTQYPLNADNPPESTAVKGCIQMLTTSSCRTSGPSVNPWPLKQWEICLANPRDQNETAKLYVYSDAGFGASTKLTFEDCS